MASIPSHLLLGTGLDLSVQQRLEASALLLGQTVSSMGQVDFTNVGPKKFSNFTKIVVSIGTNPAFKA